MQKPKSTKHFRFTWPYLTKSELEAAISGELAIKYPLGNYNLRLDEKELIEFEKLKKCGYISGYRNKDKKLRQVYWHWCEIEKRPFIAAYPDKGDSSYVSLDCRHTDYQLSDDAIGQINAIAEQYYRKPRKNEELFIVQNSGYYCQVRWIPKADLEQIILMIASITFGNTQNLIRKEAESSLQNFPLDVLKEKAQRALRKPQKRETVAQEYNRDPYVAEFAKRRANGICQLCKSLAPFKDKNGEPFLETHHIKWLSTGGEDTIENTVGLCPNCHRKMHALNLPEDVENLKQIAKSD
jgi:hypothetical protein